MPAPRSVDDVVQRLDELLTEDPALRERLERSLVLAHDRARADLDEAVFRALTWPTDLDAYRDYLRAFQRWIPQQTDDPAWREPSPEHRYAQEVSVRVAHFFWLVDQHEDDEPAVEDAPGFTGWLTEFARQWGSFLDTTESFGREILQSFLDNAPEYTIEESMVDGFPNAPSGWLTFNQFFARELNPGLRPITAPADNAVLTSPADCTFAHCYDIGPSSEIPATTVKRTHTYGTVPQLIEGSRFADAFAGGTFSHYMLPPSSYHRFHLPVGGRIEESYVRQGRVFMQVDLVDGQLESRDASTSGFEFTQTRGVLTIDTSVGHGPDIGVVAVVAVGMAHVASVRLTAVPGTTATKGQEFGFFQFGGSDIIVCLQAGVAEHVDTEESPRKVGTPIATARPRSAH